MLNRQVTANIINQSDQKAVSVNIYDINLDDNVITCELVDKEGNIFVRKRIFGIDRMPFDLTEMDIAELYAEPLPEEPVDSIKDE